MPTETRPPPVPLPAALRLPPHRSVVGLGPGARLLGLDPAVALAVEQLPPVLADMLDELVAPVGRAGLVARAVGRGADADAAEQLLRELVGAGAVVDAAGPGHRARLRADATVVVEGDGPLAVGVVLGLVRGGVGTVHVGTSGPVLDSDLGTGYLDTDRGQDRSAAIRTAATRLDPDAAVTAVPRRLLPDLVVLTDALVPEPARVAQLQAAGTAHLLARLRDGVGVVGPLVLPGRSACLGCLELRRRAGDPDWPIVAAQLVGRRGHADPATTAATAALAAAQALAALDGTASGGARPPTLEVTLELDVTAGTLTRRSWTPEPGCGCRAAATGGVRHRRATSADDQGGGTIDG